MCNGVSKLVCVWPRRAQRKFRERQKQKLAESEERARDLERALERVRLEKSALEMRNALLEKIVAMRDGGGSAGGPPGLPPHLQGSPEVPPRALAPRQGRRSSEDRSTPLQTGQTQIVELSVRKGEILPLMTVLVHHDLSRAIALGFDIVFCLDCLR